MDSKTNLIKDILGQRSLVTSKDMLSAAFFLMITLLIKKRKESDVLIIACLMFVFIFLAILIFLVFFINFSKIVFLISFLCGGLFSFSVLYLVCLLIVEEIRDKDPYAH